MPPPHKNHAIPPEELFHYAHSDEGEVVRSITFSLLDEPHWPSVRPLPLDERHCAPRRRPIALAKAMLGRRASVALNSEYMVLK